MPTNPIPHLTADVWSDAVSGLSGRARAELEDLEPGLRYAVYIELRNHSFSPVAVTNQPQIHAELFSAPGKPVRTMGFPMSGALPDRQWAVIPRDAYLGIRVDMQTVGIPTREHGMALLAVGGKTWGLRAGRYVLKIALVFKREKDAPQNQWVGRLELVPFEMLVTAQMLAVNS